MGVLGGVIGATECSVCIVSSGELLVVIGRGRLLRGIVGIVCSGRRVGGMLVLAWSSMVDANLWDRRRSEISIILLRHLNSEIYAAARQVACCESERDWNVRHGVAKKRAEEEDDEWAERAAWEGQRTGSTG